MGAQQNSGAVSPELDEMVCDLIGYALDALADGEDPGVLACAEDAHGGRIEAAFSDDGEEACIEAAQDFIRLNRNGSAQDGMGEIDRYAIACTGAVELDGTYCDAILVSFYERSLPCGYSAYVLFENAGAGDEFAWAEPAPAGEEESLI